MQCRVVNSCIQLLSSKQRFRRSSLLLRWTLNSSKVIVHLGIKTYLNHNYTRMSAITRIVATNCSRSAIAQWQKPVSSAFWVQVRRLWKLCKLVGSHFCSWLNVHKSVHVSPHLFLNHTFHGISDSVAPRPQRPPLKKHLRSHIWPHIAIHNRYN